MGHLIQKVRDFGPDQHGDHSAGTETIGQDDSIGAGFHQLAFRLLVDGSSHDQEVRPHATRAEHDEYVLGIGIGGHQQAAGPLDSRLSQ